VAGFEQLAVAARDYKTGQGAEKERRPTDCLSFDRRKTGGDVGGNGLIDLGAATGKRPPRVAKQGVVGGKPTQSAATVLRRLRPKYAAILQNAENRGKLVLTTVITTPSLASDHLSFARQSPDKYGTCEYPRLDSNQRPTV